MPSRPGAACRTDTATGAEVIDGRTRATAGFKTEDLLQCVGDKLNVGHNPAVESMARLIEHSVRAGEPLNVVAHSQGALCTSRAVRTYRECMSLRRRRLLCSMRHSIRRLNLRSPWNRRTMRRRQRREPLVEPHRDGGGGDRFSPAGPQSLRNTTEASQPVRSAIRAVARP